MSSRSSRLPSPIGDYRLAGDVGTIPRMGNRSDYRLARQASGLLLIMLACAIALLDAFRTDFEASPLIVTPILLTAAALFAVDVPGIPPKTKPDEKPKDGDL